MDEGTPARCALCGGTLVDKLITHEIRKGEELLVFDNVPALVCTQCDGVWMTDEIKRKLDEIVAKETS
jgi:YgiT-type zinc finger domain-containing protein